MNDNDPFWNLSDLSAISNQADLLEELGKADTLKRMWYRPLVLEPEEGKRTEFRNKQFVDCRFSHTRIVGITFRNCTFEGCLFIGSTFKECRFHGCEFKSTNTHKISIEKTYIDPLSFRDCLDRTKHQNVGTHLFQELLKNSRDEDQIHFERDARFLFLRWERYQKRYELRKKRSEICIRTLKLGLVYEVMKDSLLCFGGWFWEVAAGSGLRIGRFAVSAISTAAVFSGVNYLCKEELGLQRGGVSIEGYWDALYFTIISLTTLGYGDITPTSNAGQILASFQSVVGFILFATLASMLFRRFFP